LPRASGNTSASPAGRGDEAELEEAVKGDDVSQFFIVTAEDAGLPT
jgi:hypothetical protein